MMRTANKDTFEEAAALKDWTNRNSEVFSARRVRWMFHRLFAETGVRIEIPSFNPSIDYTCAEWWKTEAGMIMFQNEVLKYLYCRLKY